MIQSVTRLYADVVAQVHRVFVGQDELIRGCMIALLAGGHVLIESVPGLGKTLLVRTLGRAMGCQFGRIQFTADLMPSDITGAPVFDLQKSEFEFRPGPVFTQFLLADEINRSPAKTHTALLETMQERRVTIDGVSHPVPEPFLVLATQNPLESEGTYNLPEAQLDRFLFKLKIDYPTAEHEAQILRMHSRPVDLDQRLSEDVRPACDASSLLRAIQICARVHVSDPLLDYVNAIVRRTRNWPSFFCGASPRAGLTIVQAARVAAAIDGRHFATPDDVTSVAIASLRHRVQMTAEAEIEDRDVDTELKQLIQTIEVPRSAVTPPAGTPNRTTPISPAPASPRSTSPVSASSPPVPPPSNA